MKMQALYNCELNLDLLIYMEPLFKKFRQKMEASQMDASQFMKIKF